MTYQSTYMMADSSFDDPQNMPETDTTASGELSAAELAHQQALKYGEDLRRIYLAEKAKRQELQLTNQLLNAVFDSTPDGLVVLDDDLNVQQANPVFLQFIEARADEVVQQPLTEVIPSAPLMDWLRTMSGERTGRAQLEFNLEMPIRRSLVANVARLEAGPQQGWVLTLHDQTERKQLEYQKIEFINIASHELRTPLASLVGLSELLVEILDEEEVGDLEVYIRGMHEASIRLAGIVDELVNFTQLSEGSLQPSDTTTASLSGLIADIVDQLEPQAEEKGISLTIDPSDGGMELHLNVVLLRAALHQLILNGINFNKPGGSVHVETIRSNGEVSIHVSDTGIGIPQSEIETIFQPFFQVEDHNTRHVGGLGLGLSIVQHAVSQLSGSLSVDSTLGEGSTFVLTLPIEQPTPGNVVAEMQAKLDASHKQSLAYARDIRALYDKLQQHFIETLRAITEALEARDDYLRGHTERVTQLAVEIGREMSLSSQQLESLELGSRVHDIGKIGMPDAVLYEADGLPEREYAIRYHVDRGEQILSPLEFLEDALPIALSHHARYDGQGYPDGLSGEDIPLGARILAVANDFDIMTSPRPHRVPLPREEAMATIRAGAGTEWDPNVVQAFLKVMDHGEA